MKISAMASLDLQLYLEMINKFLKHLQNKYCINIQETQEIAEIVTFTEIFLMKNFVSYALYGTPANGCFYGECTFQSLTSISEINIELLTVSTKAYLIFPL